MKKRGQITIFIIIAIILIAGILLFFITKGLNPLDIFRTSAPEPQAYIEKCTKDTTQNAIQILLPQAGYLEPTNYKLYQDNKVQYLCYNYNYYLTCIQQEPNYIQHLEQEIATYIEPKIKDCFYSLKQEYEKRKYSVNEGVLNLNVKLKPKKVEVEIEKKFELTKNQETRKFDEFKINFVSSLFDIASVAMEISAQEAKYCNFEYVGYMLLYPEFNINKVSVGSARTASKIYTIQDRTSREKLYIAIRSCAIPPGLG